MSNQSVQFSVSNQSVSLSRVLMEISSLVFYAFWLDICYKCQKLIMPNFVKFKSPNFCQYLNLKYGLYQFFKKFIILLVLKRAKWMFTGYAIFQCKSHVCWYSYWRVLVRNSCSKSDGRIIGSSIYLLINYLINQFIMICCLQTDVRQIFFFCCKQT